MDVYNKAQIKILTDFVRGFFLKEGLDKFYNMIQLVVVLYSWHCFQLNESDFFKHETQSGRVHPLCWTIIVEQTPFC